MNNLVSFGRQLMSFMAQVEEKALSLLLLVMIILSCSLILLRMSGTSGGMLWADQLLRYLVLWSGFLGAAMATSKDRHISLDVFGTFLPPGFKVWVLLLTHVFSAVVSVLLTWASFLFILSEKEYATAGLLGLSSYQWNLIFPISFCLITFRYLFKTTRVIQSVVTGKPLPEPPSP